MFFRYFWLILVCLFWLLLSLIVTLPADAQTFPGCEGHGCIAWADANKDNRQVCYVDSRSASSVNLGSCGTRCYRGSIKYCASLTGSQSSPLYIVPRVSGVLRLNDILRIEGAYKWYAGQTAPRPGIEFRQTTLRSENANNIVVEHAGFWAGSEAGGPNEDANGKLNRDACRLRSSSKVVWSNIACIWGVDENMEVKTSTDVTLQNFIIGEGLQCTGKHVDGDQCHSMGLIIGVSPDDPSSQRVSILRGFLTHNNERNVRTVNVYKGEFINLVGYDWGNGNSVTFNDGNSNKPLAIDIIGSYYKAGPSSGTPPTTSFISRVISPPPSGSLYYFPPGQICPNDPTGTGSQYACMSYGPGSNSSYKSATRVAASTGSIAATILAAAQAKQLIIDEGMVGPNPYEWRTNNQAPYARLRSEFLNNTGRIVDCVTGCAKQAEAAWPTRAENQDLSITLPETGAAIDAWLEAKRQIALYGDGSPTPTPTPITPTPTPTATATSTPAPPTPTPTATPTGTIAATPTATSTPVTPTATATPTSSVTVEPTVPPSPFWPWWRRQPAN